ncbi:AGAP004411-PA [Anopheles gambiae str. PEST]|uniref:AGAP004411-PA n=1 Tax=Anopheles gambiae TaxID=7165 RepID=A0NDN5_ANOGA|nr:AGAP004411-PA [Anopheles gambiae str. PEST]
MPISAPKIPDGLPELMRGLAKSVIKENPENLYVHAAEYFENLIRERDGHLDHGYPTFNAYQVYADYKEKTREKLGLTKDPSLSDGNGGDGDESGSGGSESKMRGRKRRRARKPTTRERDNPTTMVGNPSVSDEGEPQKLKSLSEESAPAPVVEQEIVKVHYNPPEATPSPGRVVSAQSVEAEHAVSSILDDEQILDSDGTTGGKETGDELVDNGDDVGTAPSTAEVAERPRVPTVDNLEPSGEMPLQDMETCFVHANVDDLLEKHSEDYKTEQGNELGGVPEETKVSSVTTGEGEDIPEGPQVEVQPKSVGDEGTSQHAHEVPKDDDENTEIQMVGQQQVDIETRPAAVEGAEVDSETKPIPVEGTEVQTTADFDGSEENNDKEDKIDNESGKQDEKLVTNEIKPEENDEIVEENSIEEKGNQLSDPATDPVIDQEVTGEQQATESSTDKSDIAKPEIEEKSESANTQDNEHEQSNEETPNHEVSLEEVVEEPCVKREVTPSKTGPLEKEDSTEKQVEEREEIKKVDLSQLSKDSAEALFYSLKKSELENQDPADGGTTGDDHTTTATNAAIEPQKTEEDDDQDVVVKEEPVATSSEDRTKRTFTDDFLDETPITEAATPTTTLPCDGATKALDPIPIEQERTSLEADEQKDEFNPMVMVSMRSKQFQEQLHSRDAGEQLGEGQADDATPKRPIMRRCMTEMSGLQRYDPAVDEDPADSRPSTEDPSYVEEEDQFDGYYIGHIKNKILASSVSVADSDCPDGTRSSVESVDENQVRTALETIASTDTESTIASQATIQQAGRRSYLRKHSQNTSSNIPYASFGNAAIDQSLDEFIEREEQHKQDEAMAEAATKIQRSYRTHKKKLLRDYHSTMRTCTEDQSAESGEEYAASVIQIKLDQRRPDGPDPAEGGDAGEESDSATASHQQPLGATGRRPMYSLNIDEYDTVARRMTLTRGVAMQRNSTPEDDSGKSSNVSTDRKPSLTSSVATAKKDSAPASESGASESRSSSDEKPPKADATQGSSDEPEPKDGALNSSRSKPKSGPAGTVTEREQHAVSAPRTATSLRTSFAPLDVQSLLLIARQRTMPVQIDSSVIRVLPKHMRKRISSAGMLDGNGKRK